MIKFYICLIDRNPTGLSAIDVRWNLGTKEVALGNLPAILQQREIQNAVSMEPFIGHLNFGSVDARRRFDELFRYNLVCEDSVIPLASSLAAAIGSYSRDTESTTVFEESLGGIQESQIRSYLSGVGFFPVEGEPFRAYQARIQPLNQLGFQSRARIWNYFQDAWKNQSTVILFTCQNDWGANAGGQVTYSLPRQSFWPRLNGYAKPSLNTAICQYFFKLC